MATAERFEDLVTWQRMYELSLKVYSATEGPPASKDFHFRDQIRDASDSAHRNVAEGFGRYNPPQFVNFLDISRASANETRALVRKGRDLGYFTQEQFNELDSLAARGLQALAKFQRYLRTPQARRNAEQNRYRHSRNDTTRKNDANAPNANHPNANAPNANHRNANHPNANAPNANAPNAPNDPNGPNE